MFKESCITEQTQYFFDNDERSYSGVLDCGNCSRYVSSCYCMCTNLYCVCSHFCGSVPSYCALLNIFPPLTVSSSWTSFCLMVCRDGSRIGLVSWPLSVFHPDFRQLFSDDSQSDTDYLDLSVTRIAEARTKALLSVFFFSFCCFFWLALWLYFKLTNTHIHGPLHIYFALTSFCVNFGCRRGLNMAVITGYYESHVSVALLPNANDWRHRNFHDYHKKKKNNPKRREEVWMCTYVHNWVCMQCRFTV